VRGLVFVGIDDTDITGSPGTNQLARALLDRPAFTSAEAVVVRHQLLSDPRVPYTSKNGSASLILTAPAASTLEELATDARMRMREWYVEGSDPGLCIAASVPAEVTAFGERCQRELIDPQTARDLAALHGIHLEGLGGTEQGVIGALAAIGLAAGGHDGRVVHMRGWPWPDPFAGVQRVQAIAARGVDAILPARGGGIVTAGLVDVGKHLRPAWRGGRVVLLVDPAPAGTNADWRARKV
jgi:hypothetical protein